MVDEGVGGRGRRGSPAGGDDGGSALADFFAELTLEPGAVVDQFLGRLALDFGVAESGEHRRAVVAENENLRNLGGCDASLFGEHGLGAVLVEADHGGEAVGGETAGHAGGDHGIRVGGISHHGHTGVLGGDFIDDAALGCKNFAVVLEEVGALHAGAAGLGTHEEAPVGVFETDLRVVGENHSLE